MGGAFGSRDLAVKRGDRARGTESPMSFPKREKQEHDRRSGPAVASREEKRESQSRGPLDR